MNAASKLNLSQPEMLPIRVVGFTKGCQNWSPFCSTTKRLKVIVTIHFYFNNILINTTGYKYLITGVSRKLSLWISTRKRIPRMKMYWERKSTQLKIPSWKYPESRYSEKEEKAAAEESSRLVSEFPPKRNQRSGQLKQQN